MLLRNKMSPLASVTVHSRQDSLLTYYGEDKDD